MIKDCELLVNYIYENICENVDIAVVGLSGGADSTLTALLCKNALGKDKVWGISMPYNETDLKTFNKVSESFAKFIGINHLKRPINKIADSINDLIFSNSPHELSDLNRGNSRSRARMCVLYGLSHTLSSIYNCRVRVIGTGNLSEDFIGYDTKGGDSLADIFPIGDLFKSEVYQLLEYFRNKSEILEEHINRIPSAGLMENQTDENELGFSYDQIEPAIRFCLKELELASYNYKKIDISIMNEITKFVFNRHIAHKHKHEAQKVIKSRNFCI